MSPPRRSGPRSASIHERMIHLWKAGHGPEYVGILVLLLAWMLLRLVVRPFHQLFFVNDPRIAYPYAEVERVSTPMNIVYAFAVPAAVLVAFNSLTRASAVKHEATYLAFLISLTLTGFLTHLLKNAVGRPRPDFLSRCLPLPPHPAQFSPSSPLGAIPIPSSIADCTAPPGWKLQDGWRSFPSGHASFAFSGLGFLALFLAGQLAVFQPGSGGRDLSRTVAFLLPLVGAGWIAISRCQDYRHDVYDVGVGSLIGITAAFWSYRRHWPSLGEKGCDEPYPHPGLGVEGWDVLGTEEGVEMADLEEGGGGLGR